MWAEFKCIVVMFFTLVACLYCISSSDQCLWCSVWKCYLGISVWKGRLEQKGQGVLDLNAVCFLYHSNTCLRVLSCLEPVLQLKTNMHVNVNQLVPMFWVLFLVYIFFTNSLIKMCDKWYCTKKSSTTAPPIINSIRNKYTSIKTTLE